METLQNAKTETRNLHIARFAIVVLFLVSLVPFWALSVDDSYISYTYAKNLVSGNGLTYNGEVVEGFSNPLWTVLMAGPIILGIDPLTAARLISVAAVSISLVLVFNLSLELTGSGDFRDAFLGTITVATLAPVLAWTVGGLETMFLGALIVGLIAVEAKGNVALPMLAPLLLVVISLTRPEGILLFPLWLGYRVTRNRTALKPVLIQSLFVLSAVGAFVLWRWSTYGYPLSNTAYLKLGGGQNTIGLAASWILSFFALRPLFSLLVLGSLVAFIRNQTWRRSTLYLLPVSILAGFIAFILFSGRDWMPHHRFLAPALLPLALVISQFLTNLERSRFRRAASILVLATITFELVMAWTLYRPLNIEFGKFTNGLIDAGNWVKENTEEDSIIAVVDAGALAYFSERRTVDILGLNSTRIAHSPDKLDIEFVMSHDPRVIQLHVGFSPSGQIATPTDGKHNQMILDHPEFRSCYVPDLNRPEDPYYPFLFLRKCD